MFSAVFAAVVLAQAAPAADAPRPADAQVAPADAKGPKVDKDGLVCHTEEVLGSRIPKRICYTPEAAAQRQQEDRRTIEHMQSRNSGKSPG